MRKLIGLLTTSALMLTLAGSTAAITRVAPKVNILEFHAGYGMPQGTYDQIIGTEFLFDPYEIVDFDADRVYNNAFYFGLNYGQVIGGHWQATVGFDFAQSKLENPIEQIIGYYLYSVGFLGDPTWRSYDLNLKAVYGLNDLVNSSWSPFLGLGVTGGLSTLSAKGYESQSNATYALSVDFGLDAKIWHDVEDRTFVTISSINSYELVGSGDRARLLRIGGGIKYFFRP